MNHKIVSTVAAGALCLLAACTSAGVGADIAAAEQSLTAIEQAALIYTSLPRCPAAAPCSDPATVAKIKALDNQAYTAVMAARNNSALLSAAIAAITNFSAAIPAVR